LKVQLSKIGIVKKILLNYKIEDDEFLKKK